MCVAVHCTQQHATSGLLLANAPIRVARGLGLAPYPAAPLPSLPSKKGDFIHSNHDNRDKFNAIFGPKLAAYILQLIEQDAK